MINFIQKSFGINTQINTVDQDIAVLQNKLRDLELQLQKRESNNLKPAPIDFDQYIKKCYNKYIEIMDEIEQTQNQLQLQKNSRQDYEYKNNVQQRILQKEQKYKELQEEVKNLKQINTELKNNIKQKDFYREYDLMCKEVLFIDNCSRWKDQLDKIKIFKIKQLQSVDFQNLFKSNIYNYFN